VIHRDLKPGNVMITRSGAKLMDFGLARTGSLASGESDLTLAVSPTMAHPLTQEGAIVGTFQYMAPEQLEGQEVDHRSDLWALGCVLYEMATGHRAFEGATQASLIGSIMHAQPELVSQRLQVSPPEFDRIVSACLVKDPDDRLQSAHDVKLQLSWMHDGPPSSSMAMQAPEIPRARARRAGLPTALFVVLAGMLGAGVMWLAGPGGDDGDPTVTNEPVRYRLGEWNLRSAMTPVISPDGQSVFFCVREGLESSIYARDLDSFEAREIQGTKGGFAPFFSPDGRWIGFMTDDAVRKVPVTGGVPQQLARLAGINSADWGSDGFIYLSTGNGGETGEVAMYRVAEDGGEVEVFGKLVPENNEGGVWLPEVLPGDEIVLLTLLGARTKIVAFGKDGARHDVVENAFLGRYVEPGYLLYQDLSSQALAAVPFDPVTAQVTGGPVVITEQVNGSHCFDVTEHGLLVYVPAPVEGEGRVLTWVDREGRTEVAVDVKVSCAQPRISPDGRRVLTRKTGSNCELWMLDLERGSFARMVQGDDNHDAIWAPDSKRILFDRTEMGALVTLEVAGSRRSETIASGGNRGRPESWSAGNDLFAYTVSGEAGLPDIWIRKMSDGGEGEPFLATPQAETEPRVSPDGRWIAYTSDETGVPEVYVRGYPDDGSAWQASAGGGNNPLWSRDGKELFFVRITDAGLMSVSVVSERDLELGVPQKLFEGLLSTSRIGDFDVAADGRFITVAGEGGQSNRREIRVLSNWRAMVERLKGEAR
jgi:serine/threonine-protein kinase